MRRWFMPRKSLDDMTDQELAQERERLKSVSEERYYGYNNSHIDDLNNGSHYAIDPVAREQGYMKSAVIYAALAPIMGVAILLFIFSLA